MPTATATTDLQARRDALIDELNAIAAERAKFARVVAEVAARFKTVGAKFPNQAAAAAEAGIMLDRLNTFNTRVRRAKAAARTLAHRGGLPQATIAQTEELTDLLEIYKGFGVEVFYRARGYHLQQERVAKRQAHQKTIAAKIRNAGRFPWQPESATLEPFAWYAPGVVYKLAKRGGVDGRVRGEITTPSIDVAKMSVAAVISTSRIDRDGEIIDPAGGSYDDYKLNPLVLWNHGMGPVDFPIARCEHPDGTLALVATKKAIEGVAYFTNSLKESEQIFAAICDGVIRGTSIHVFPRKSEQRVVDGVRVTAYTVWDMIEWSFCSLGANPDACRKALDKGLAGSPVCEGLRCFLNQYAPKPAGNGIGWRAGA